MPSLRLKIGGGATKTFALAEGAEVGRVKGVAIVLPHESVSRRHAIVHIANDRVEIEDLGSSNGTFVNDRAIVRQSLAHGDRVRFGRVVLDFDAEIETQPDAPRAEFSADDWADDDLELELELPEQASSVPTAPSASEPRIEMRPRAVEPAVRPASQAPEVDAIPRQRILQYRKVESTNGLLGQDLSQWGWVTRALAVIVVLGLSAGIFLVAKWLGGGLAG